MLSFIFPFLFRVGPDGKKHWKGKRFCEYIKDGVWYIYDFEQDSTYEDKVHSDEVLESVRNELQRQCSEERRIRTQELAKASKLKTDIKEELSTQKRIYQDTLDEKFEVEKELAVTEAKLEGAEKRIAGLMDEKKEIRSWFEDELVARDDLNKKLRALVSESRDSNQQMLEDIEKAHSLSLEALGKQLELLDRDFVNVAKAMRVYSADEDRPSRGFRIKMG